MSIFFAFMSALAYGVSDFAGGFASRRHSALNVILLSYPVSAFAVLLVCPLFGGTLTLSSVIFGIGSGMAMAVAIWWFYAALARGPMSIVSPITAVLVAVLPVIVGVSIGEYISQIAAIGIAMAISSVFLISRQTPETSSIGTVIKLPLTGSVFMFTVGAGIAFSLSFAFIHRIPTGAGLWPIFLARLSATFFVVLAGWKSAKKLIQNRPNNDLFGFAVLIGILDALSNVAMYYALNGSKLSTTSVVISLYPVFTILLSILIVKEAVNRIQCFGVAVAISAIAVISYAS